MNDETAREALEPRSTIVLVRDLCNAQNERIEAMQQAHALEIQMLREHIARLEGVLERKMQAIEDLYDLDLDKEREDEADEWLRTALQEMEDDDEDQ